MYSFIYRRNVYSCMVPNVTEIRTLLLIDDDSDHADVFMDALLAMDGPYKGEWVTNLSEGIERLKGAEIWAVFVNLMLPDSQGLATVRRLLLAVPNVPTLILAGTQDVAVALEALRHGAQGYLLEDHLDKESFVRAI